MTSLCFAVGTSSLFWCGIAALAADVQTVQLGVRDWNKTTVFEWTIDRCAETDTPDAPPRAMRNFHGAITLFAAHDDNREFIGPDFSHLKHPCRIIYQGRHSDDPATFSDRQWLTGFSTEDGKRVYALVHDEFQGDKRPALCPSGKYLSCWENAVTLAVSDDGGSSFHEAAPPNNLVASIPYRYQGDIGRPIGYFQPSNLVRKQGYYYSMFHAEAFYSQTVGACVARTKDLPNPKSWRAWDGQRFAVEFENPYHESKGRLEDHVCQTVGVGKLFDIGALVFDEGTRLFLALSSIAHGGGTAATPPGVYVSTSKDLIFWSSPSLVVSEHDLQGRDKSQNNFYGFYSLIDERSNARDFSTISAEPALFLYFIEMDQQRAPYNRNLVKLALTRQTVAVP